MPKARVIYYMNQFFAGVGSEDKADVPVDFRPGAVGPGKRLQELLKDSAEIVATVYCGDNYFTNHTAEALEAIVRIARDQKVKLLVAGPAFASGRYGFACAEVCHAASSALDIDCVTAMYPENPGVETYKQYKDYRVYAFPTSEVVTGMNDALSKIAPFVARLASGAKIGIPPVEGYIPRGFRLDEVAADSGAVRAVRMLVDKLAGRPFITEIPVESLESIPVPPKITNLKDVHLALVTTSGVMAMGNPDAFRGYQNTKWAKYPISKLSSMLDAPWDAVHGGYNTEFMKKNPNYGVPLDVCRDMEKEGVFRKLYGYFYTTPGARGLISVMHRLGKEMFDDMKKDGVNAVLLVATWGSCTRSGSAIARAIEKEGMPVAYITAMSMMAKQLGANRVVTGTKIPHPCGDPSLPPEADKALRREIVNCAMTALQSDVDGRTIFVPDATFTSG